MIKIPSTNPNAVHEWIEAVNEYETDYTISSVEGLNAHFTLAEPFTLKVFKQGKNITLVAAIKISADSSATGTCGAFAIGLAGKADMPDSTVADTMAVCSSKGSGAQAISSAYIYPEPATLTCSSLTIPPSSAFYFILNLDYHI